MLQFSGLLVVCFCVFCWGGHFWSFEAVGLDEFLKLGWEAGKSAWNHVESFGIDENWVLKKSERQGFRHVCVRKACKSLLTGSQGGSIVGVRKGNPSFLSYSSQKWVLFFSDSDWFDLVCLILLFLFVPGIQHCSSMIHRRIACRSRFIRSFVATVWSMATARWGKKWGSPIWSGLLLPRHHGPAGSSSKSRPGWNAASGRQSIVCSVIVNPMVIRCYQQHLYLFIPCPRCCWFSFLLSYV